MNKKVYVGMSADLIHPGHLNIIAKARSLGDVYLGLLTDKAIASYKRVPYLNYEQRFEIMSNIKGIHKIMRQESLDYSDNLLRIKPDYVVHGDDWKTGIQSTTRQNVIDLLKTWGGQLIEVEYTKGISSTQLQESIKNINFNPSIRLNSLKRILNAKSTAKFIDVHSALSGLIIDNLEIDTKSGKNIFDGMWSSSLVDSTFFGKPDNESVNIPFRISMLEPVLECTTKPIIFDGDTGGKIEHINFIIKSLERNGISAVIFEDKIGLKRNSLLGNTVTQYQDDPRDFGLKIKTAVESKANDNFMIFARIESLILDKGINDALNRAEIYLENKADGILIHSRQKNSEEITTFCNNFRKITKSVPLAVVPTSYNSIKAKELEDLGVNIIIYANHLLRSVYPAMLKTMQSILINDRTYEIDQEILSIENLLSIIPGTK